MKAVCICISFLLLLTVKFCRAQSIRFDTTVIRCGQVIDGEVVRREVSFTNIAKVPLQITLVRSTGGGQVAEWNKETVMPNNKGMVTILYSTRAKIGRFRKALYVYNSLEPDTFITLFIEGEVIPGDETIMKFDSAEYHLGRIPMGPRVDREFTFTNTGTKDLLIQEVITQDGASTPSWSKEPVRPGEKGVIKWSSITEARIGLKHQSFYVRYNNPNPCSVSISSEVFRSEQEPWLELSAYEIDLDTITSTNLPEAIQIKYVNKGKKPLEIRHITPLCSLQNGMGPEFPKGMEFAWISFTDKELGYGESGSIKVDINFSRVSRGEFWIKGLIYSNDPLGSHEFRIRGVYLP